MSEPAASRTDPPAQPRDAATVVVLRDGKNAIEVYLIKRARTVDFMAGAHVFPGGRLDRNDSSAPACALLSAGTAALHERLGEALPAMQAAGLYVAAIRIPLGTVWSEEAAYRAALGTLAAEAFGPTGGRLLQSATFGLSHIADARATGEPVIGTVIVTGLVGWLFGVLFERSGSLAAPMLAHLAINEAGAVAALAVQRAGYTSRMSATS